MKAIFTANPRNLPVGRSSLCKECLNYRGRGKCAKAKEGPVITETGVPGVASAIFCTRCVFNHRPDFFEPLPLP